jgi:hypothetical protein
MAIYVPDRWVVLEFTSEFGVCRKVFGGWYGGYCSSDYWKLNSGIVGVTDTGEYLNFLGQSGSVYECYRSMHGMSAYMSSVFDQWVLGFKNDPLVKLKEIRLEDIVIS